MCLLSLVTAKVQTGPLCFLKTVSCLFSKRFHTLIFLSAEPEIMYLLSLVTFTHLTQSICPCKSRSNIGKFLDFIYYCQRLFTLICTRTIMQISLDQSIVKGLKNSRFQK